MIALITPTGSREHQFKLCAQFMRNQTYAGAVAWVIVDDALPITTEGINGNFRAGWEVIKSYPLPKWEIGQNTQGRNLKAGIDTLFQNYERKSIDAIFVIEDDDYYRSCYLQEMVNRIDGGLVWGETHTIYYNVRNRRWIENQNDKWSSLFQMAFKPAALKYFEKLYSEKFIDYVFCQTTPNVKLFRTKDKLSIGIKGQPGRAGIGAGHGFIPHMIADPDGVKLKELLLDDSKYYL